MAETIVDFIEKCMRGIKIINIDQVTADEISRSITTGFQDRVSIEHVQNNIKSILTENDYRVSEIEEILTFRR